MKQEERQERSRREILRAAMAEFGAHDYESVTVDGICAGHGISKGMMYHYYTGKDELFLLCVREVFEALEAHIRDASKSAPEQRGLEAIQSLFLVREDFFQMRPELEHIFVDAVLRTPRHLTEQIAELRRPLREWNRRLFHRAASQMELRSTLDAGRASRYLEGIELVFWTLVRQYQDSEPVGGLRDLRSVAEQVLDMALRGIVRQTEA